MDQLFEWIYRICNWIYKLAITNILWILFTLVGLGIFGLFPATVATFSVMRNWVIKKDDSLFHIFWQTYRQEFWKANLLGLSLSSFGVFLYLDLQVLQYFNHPLLSYLSFIYFPMIILYMLMVFYIFPVYVQYDLTVVQIVKNAFLLSISNLAATSIMIIGSFVIFFILFSLPTASIFFGVSSFALLMMWSANLAFNKYEKKLQLISTDRSA